MSCNLLRYLLEDSQCWLIKQREIVFAFCHPVPVALWTVVQGMFLSSDVLLIMEVVDTF
jgi:hypothetical protein